MVLVEEGLTVVGGWKLVEALGDQPTFLRGTAWGSWGSRGVKGGFQGGWLTCTLACQAYLANLDPNIYTNDAC